MYLILTILNRIELWCSSCYYKM